jgi:hypothetical protein
MYYLLFTIAVGMFYHYILLCVMILPEDGYYKQPKRVAVLNLNLLMWRIG